MLQGERLTVRNIVKEQDRNSRTISKIAYVEDWINNRPVKILNYMTPEQIFQLHTVAIAA